MRMDQPEGRKIYRLLNPRLWQVGIGFVLLGALAGALIQPVVGRYAAGFFLVIIVTIVALDRRLFVSLR
jgi:hypothetical protein